MLIAAIINIMYTHTGAERSELLSVTLDLLIYVYGCLVNETAIIRTMDKIITNVTKTSYIKNIVAHKQTQTQLIQKIIYTYAYGLCRNNIPSSIDGLCGLVGRLHSGVSFVYLR